MILTLALSLGFLFSEKVSRVVDVQLTSETVASFESWLIKLDNNQVYTFGEAGQLSITLTAETRHFVILDHQRQTRFKGNWNQYPGNGPFQIEVPKRFIAEQQVVTASRHRQTAWEVANQVNVVQPGQQAEVSLTQTSDLLKEQSPVLLQKTNLGGGSPIIRGMSGNRILLMVDGFRLNNATFRLGLNQYLNTIPDSQLDQIEILSGPTGVQYGSDGLGGTIHLRSVDPSLMGQSNLGYRGYASSGDGSQTHQVSGNSRHGAWAWSAHGKFNRYEDLRAGSPVGRQMPTGYDSWDGSLHATYQMEGNKRLRFINTVSDARHVPRTDRIQSGLDLLWEYSPQKLRIHGLRFEMQSSSKWMDFLDLGVGQFRQEEGTRRISSGSPDRLSETFTTVGTTQVNGTFTKILPRAKLIYGFDFQSDGLDSGGRETDLVAQETQTVAGKFPGDSKYQSVGSFATIDRQINDRQRVQLGLRQTWVHLEGTLVQPIGAVDERYSQFTPSLSWSVDAQNHFLSLGVSQGFRAPNLEDALSLGPSNRGFDAPNPNLDPETLVNLELNYRWRHAGGLLQATVFRGFYQKLIERVTGTYLGQTVYEDEPVFILDNIGKAKIDGVSLRYERRINQNHRFHTDASWTYGRQTEQGVPMTRIPPLRGNLSWVYEKKWLRVSGISTWADRQDRLSPSDLADSRIPVDGTPGYMAFHLRGRATLSDNLSLNLGLENIGDKLYKSHGSGIYEPGRRVVAEISARWR